MDDGERGTGPSEEASPNPPRRKRQRAADQDTRTEPGSSGRRHRTVPLDAQDDLPRIPGVVEMEPLGKGGMGVVYKGKQAKLERLVAIKVLGDDYRTAQAEKRFLRECKHIARLDHNHVVRCYDSGVTSRGEPYMVMEFVDGPNLSKWTSAHGPLSIVDALRVCRDLTDALEHGLDKKLIHRDVKPENVLLKPDLHPRSGGFPFHVKLADFGLSRSDREESADARVTQPGEAWGSPPTMAPEQFVMFGSVDFRADLYALGCVLYYTLTGRHAYEEKTWKTLRDAKTKGPPPDPRTLRADIPEPVVRLLTDMLQPDPKERPHSYDVLLRRLDEILEQLDPSLSGTRPRARQGTGFFWTATLLGGLSIAAAVAWGVIHWAGGGEHANGPGATSEAKSSGASKDPSDVDSGKRAVDPRPIPLPDATKLVIAPNDSDIKVGKRAFLSATSDDPEFASEHSSFAWRVVEPKGLELKLEGRDTPTVSFRTPESPSGGDYAIVLEATAENEKHATAKALATVRVKADEKTRPIAPGKTIVLFRSEQDFRQRWTPVSGSEQAFVLNDEGQVHGSKRSGRGRIELDLPRGSWKLSGKLRLERGSAASLARGSVILGAYEGLKTEVALTLEASREDELLGRSYLSFEGFDALARERITDTDYVTFEAVWNGEALSLKHGSEDIAGKVHPSTDLPRAFGDGTGPPTKLSLEVEGSELVLQEFELAGPAQ